MWWPWPTAATALLVLGQLPPEPYGALVQYGLAGILGVLLIRRYEAELDRERKARERAEAQRDELTEKAMRDMLPALVRVADTMVPALDRVSSEVERMGDRLERLERAG